MGIGENERGSDFTERLVDGFFRRWFLYAIPVVLFAGIGATSAQRIEGDFDSYGRLSVSANPYIAQPTIRGTDIAFFETPATGTARLINEQLQTDSFIDDVAARVGLADALENGVITRNELRGRISAGAIGNNNLRIGATWDDPDTAFRLVDAAIGNYIDYIVVVATVDSAEAVQFWTTRLEAAEADRTIAEDALEAYVSELPETADGQRTTEEVFGIQRLNDVIDEAITSAAAAQGSIDDAEFAEVQARSESSRLLRVIDRPAVAEAPTSVKLDQLISLAMFTLVGLVISIAALTFSTAIDRSIRSRSQLVSLAGIDSVAVIPADKQIRRNDSRSGRHRAA